MAHTQLFTPNLPVPPWPPWPPWPRSVVRFGPSGTRSVTPPIGTPQPLWFGSEQCFAGGDDAVSRNTDRLVAQDPLGNGISQLIQAPPCYARNLEIRQSAFGRQALQG